MPSKLEEMLHTAEIPVEFSDAREERLVREAAIGKDVHEWLSSHIGEFVIGAAIQDQQAIEEKLSRLRPNTPWRRRKISELQNEHQAIEMAIGWLCEAVQIGLMAERELQQPEE